MSLRINAYSAQLAIAIALATCAFATTAASTTPGGSRTSDVTVIRGGDDSTKADKYTTPLTAAQAAQALGDVTYVGGGRDATGAVIDANPTGVLRGPLSK